jgi:hypothetical protein
LSGHIHANGIENYWSLLRRGINGIYHHVSTKHLHRYCDEFAFRFNSRKLHDGFRWTLSPASKNWRRPSLLQKSQLKRNNYAYDALGCPFNDRNISILDKSPQTQKVNSL